MRGGAIYLPRQQPWYQPAANDISNFLWQLAGLKVRSNLEAQQAEIEEKRQIAAEKRQLGYAKELETHKAGLKKEEAPTLPALIQQYQLSVLQGYSGTFTDWKKEISASGATQINLGDKIKETREKKRETLQTEARYGTDFREDALRSVKSKYSDEWMDMEPYVQDELLFREMDARIREMYPNSMVTFDEAQNAWVDVKSRKILRKYSGLVPLEYKKNIR